MYARKETDKVRGPLRSLSLLRVHLCGRKNVLSSLLGVLIVTCVAASYFDVAWTSACIAKISVVLNIDFCSGRSPETRL